MQVEEITWTPARIRELRKRLGYTQTRMARALGFARFASVSDLERGEVPPSGAVLLLLDYIERYGDISE